MHVETLDSAGFDVVTDYDYSDAPELALPRDCFLNNQYELEFEEI